MRRRFLIAGVLVMALGAAATDIASDAQRDQVQRDLTRILSEVFQRAHSRALTGEVVRPEFASTKVSLTVPDLDDGWAPTCESSISAEVSDPHRNLQALILVPRDRLSGTDFTAFAVFAGDPVVDTDLFVPPLPDWLTEGAGSYPSLSDDLTTLIDRFEITVTSTVCPGFSFAEIEGTAR